MVEQALSPRLNINLHDGQLEVLEDSRRFRVIACGRRWGKTTLAVAETLLYAAEHDEALVWWVSPTHDQTKIALRMLLEAVPSEARDVNLSEKSVVLWNGSRYMFRSADRHDNLRGEGVDFLVIDEAAFVKEEAWNLSLRPTLADTLGSALLISTFNGENWFYDLYERGNDPTFEEWGSHRFKTIDNPFISPSEIDEVRRTTPQAEFEQEYEANPLVYIGAVFPGEDVQRAVERGASPREWPEGTKSYAGLDWGHNTTAFEVNEEHPTTDEVRWVEEGDWRVMPLGPDPEKEQPTKIDLIVDASRRRNILVIYADAAGATENLALKAALRDAGLKTQVVAIPFGKYKEGGITARRWYLEQGLESMSVQVPELIRTTKRYHYKEDSEDVVKEDDHPVDASIAFYASRRGSLVTK